MTGYWLVVSLGFLAFDAIDFDFDFDADLDVDPSAASAAHASILDLGFVPLRWLNLGTVPLMIWGSVFTLTAWILSRWMNAGAGHPEFIWTQDTQIIARDALLAALATKIFTNPLRGMFDFEEPNKLETLLGKTVTVTTSELSRTFGEVEYRTEAAPLRLNARLESGDGEASPLSKGDVARIVGYDKEKRVYLVEADA